MKGKNDVKLVPIISLNHFENNPRTITENGLESLERSIRENGFTFPIIVQQSTMTIIDGNQRVRALENMGETNVPAVVVDVDDQTAIKMNLQFNAAGGRHDFDVLANHFNLDFLVECGFDVFELGVGESFDDDEPIQISPRRMKFTVMCSTIGEINELRAYYDTKRRTMTFDTWKQKTFGKRAENDNDDDSFGFGGDV